MRNWDTKDLYAKGFTKGAILRVCMRNFLTFDDAEVFPGPKLNVVLGPNGTEDIDFFTFN
jgi:structural maintenance of chromosomes protein 5